MPEILVCGLSWNSSHSNPAVIETIARSIDLVIDPYVMVEGSLFLLGPRFRVFLLIRLVSPPFTLLLGLNSRA